MLYGLGTTEFSASHQVNWNFHWVTYEFLMREKLENQDTSQRSMDELRVNYLWELDGVIFGVNYSQEAAVHQKPGFCIVAYYTK